MHKSQFLGAGVALALIYGCPAYAQAPAASEISEFGIRAGEPHIMATHSQFGGLRAPKQGDNDVRGFPLSQYRAYNAKHGIVDEGDRNFHAIYAENRSTCASTGSWIRRAIDFKGRAGTLTDRNTDINARLIALGGTLNNAARVRTGGNIISTIFLCAIPGVNVRYCYGAITGNLSNQVQGMAHTKQAKLNREQSILNSDQSQLQLDISMLNLDMTIGWAEMITDYCVTYHVDSTIGTASATAQSVTKGPWPARP